MWNARLYFGLLALLVLASVVSMAQPQQLDQDENPYRCHVLRLPTSWAFDPAPGKIDSNNASFSEVGGAAVSLYFLSTQTAPIEALTLVVEYLDADGETIVRAPMYAHVDPSVAKIPANGLKPADAWGRPLAHGGSELMVGQEHGIRTGHCPVRARVTFAKVQFTDGSVRTYSASDWRLEPRPALVPTLREAVPDLPVDPPLSVLAKLRISSSGSVLDVVPNEPADPRAVSWLREIMKRGWKFYPAMLNGKPTDADLDVLFQVHAKGMAKFAETEPVLQPVTLIHFVWSHDLSAQMTGPDKLMVMYGTLIGSVLDSGVPGIYPAVALSPPQ